MTTSSRFALKAFQTSAILGCLALSQFAARTAIADPKLDRLDTSPPAGKIKWIEDFAAAKKTAATEGKDLLIDFTGSDWCGWCIRLRQEVFDQPAFAPAAKEYVFAELDYPNEKPQSNEIKLQNARLKDEFSIEGYPTIFLADAKGRPYAQTGYQAGGPDKYLRQLSDLKKVRVRRDEAWTDALKASGVERAKLLAKGLDAMDIGLVVQHYKSIVEDIAKIDPKDESGAAGKYGFQLDLVAANQMQPDQAPLTPARAREAVDKVIRSHPKATSDQKQQALFGVVNYCRAPGDNEFVIKLMDEVAKLDPASDQGKNAAAIKSQIEAKMKPAVSISSDGQIDAGNFEAITAAKGKLVVVEGEVSSVTPTKSGGNLNIILSGEAKGLLVFVRQREVAALNASNDGNFAGAIRKHRIRVRGMIDDYRGRDPRFKGRLQVAIGGTEQIQLLVGSPDAAPTTKPATPN